MIMNASLLSNQVSLTRDDYFISLGLGYIGLSIAFIQNKNSIIFNPFKMCFRSASRKSYNGHEKIMLSFRMLTSCFCVA
jgi:hypothetical protein